MTEKKEVRIVERGSPDALLISKAMSSPTAAELLDSLAAGPKTASELETETHYPLPTIQYHINNLLSANLIEVAGTRYSEKGRKMKIYAASDTLLVISPKLTTAEQIKPVLRRYGIPIAGVSAVCTAGLIAINRLLAGMERSAPAAVPDSVRTAAAQLPVMKTALFSDAAKITDASAPIPAVSPAAAPFPETAETISGNTVQNTVNNTFNFNYTGSFDALPLTETIDTTEAAGAGVPESVPYAVNAAGDAAAAAGDGTAFVLSGVQTGLLIFFIAAVAALLGMMIFEIVRIKRSGSRRKD